MEIKSWIQGKLECRSEDMESLFNSKTALHFLLVWNIFEVELFNKFCTVAGLGDVARKLSHSTCIPDLQKIIEHFHDRYKNDRAKYRNLKNSQQTILIPDGVVSRPLNKSFTEQQLHFLLFVLLRYRNNMFHGNKGLINWLRYNEQIQYCTEAMCIMVDMNRQLLPIIQSEIPSG